LSFLRKLHNHLAALQEGECILLPTVIQGQEILLLLERNTARILKSPLYNVFL
jgi:hypothetical protein